MRTIDPTEQHTRAVVRFVTLNLFSLLYLQKFAFGPGSAQISLPMVITAGSLVWMTLTRNISFAGDRLGWYLGFVGCLLFSQVLSGIAGSLPSFLELVLLYWTMTIVTDLSEGDYRRYVLDRFIKMMIVPAFIVIFQNCIQNVAGLADPLDMNAMLPHSILLQGFYYNAHYPLWSSPFTRPNGFFFLEPSFVSFFLASATIFDITHFRRPHLIGLFVAATILSTGETGLTVLMVASPFLLAREAPVTIVTVICVGIVGLLTAYLWGANIPMISRLDELDHPSSGWDRMVVPATRLVELMGDPGDFFTGRGAGATGPELGNAWPMLKLTYEYGILPTIFYVILYLLVITHDRLNIAWKVAVSFMYQFTGGYLLAGTLITFVALACLNEPPGRYPIKRSSLFSRKSADRRALVAPQRGSNYAYHILRP